MVAAAAPSSAPARRGLAAGPGWSGGPGAGMGSSRGGGGSAGAGRREVGGGRAREEDRLMRRGPASPLATPGTAGLFVWAAWRPHQALRNREGAAGAAGPGSAVLWGLRGREALGPRRERLARTG